MAAINDMFATQIANLNTNLTENIVANGVMIDHTVEAINSTFILTCTFLVFFMQAGFAFLEAGSIRANNTKAILAKNLLDLIVGSFAWLLLGHGLAYGKSFYALIGTSDFGTYGIGVGSEAEFFFEICFACTTATIVSGAVAERITLEFYAVICTTLSAFIYPIVCHWVWSADGFLNKMGFLDFAGSAAVHMVGGVCAVIATALMGPRAGRIHPETGEPIAIPGHNIAYQALGMWILFLGWFGFNPGSTFSIAGAPGDENLPSIVALNTMFGGISAGGASFLLDIYIYGKLDVCRAMNCVLAGLVSVTGIAKFTNIFSSFIIAVIGSIIYHCVSPLLINRFGIDDPLDVFAVHGANGIWGTLAIGLFHLEQGFFFTGNPKLFFVQLLGVLAIITFVSVTSISFMSLYKYAFRSLRVTPEVEAKGLDAELAGKAAYSYLGQGSETALADVLDSPELSEIFEQYLTFRSCEENFHFYKDAVAFANLTKRKHLKKAAGDMYKKYFASGCDFEINVPMWMRDYVTLRRNSPTSDLFDETRVVIQQSLQELLDNCASSNVKFAEQVSATEEAKEIKPIFFKFQSCFCCTRAKRGINLGKENAASMDVETMMEISRLKNSMTFKTLILGSGEAGKTTFVNQLNLQYHPNAYRNRIPQIVNGLRINVVTVIQHLVNIAEGQYDRSFPQDLKAARNHIMGMENSGDHIGFLSEDANKIKQLWESKVIKETFADRHNFWILESTEYYLENCHRFVEDSADSFSPNEEDMIHCRIKTTGVHEFDFHQRLSVASPKYKTVTNADKVDVIWKLVDVGGQKSERRKWLSHFSDIDSSLYVINLCGYQSVMYEDTNKLILLDAMDLLKQTYKSSSVLNNFPLTIIFNKVSMFHEQFSAVNFLTCFPECPAPLATLTSKYGCEYIIKEVLKLTHYNTAQVKYVTMNAINTEEVMRGMRLVQDNTFVDREADFKEVLKKPELFDIMENDGDGDSVSSHGSSKTGQSGRSQSKGSNVARIEELDFDIDDKMDETANMADFSCVDIPEDNM